MESMTLNRTPTDVIADRLTPSGYSPLVHVGERCSLSSLYVDSLDRGQCSTLLLSILDCCLVSVHASFPSVNPHLRGNHQPESRMREIRQSGSEGGGAETNRPSLPLSKAPCGRTSDPVSSERFDS